jgi:hypothetical protein
MRKLLLFVILSISCLAETISFGYSLNTTHIKPSDKDYDFVEDNQVFTLEKRIGSEIKGISLFTNSFGNDSQMVYIGQVKDKNNKKFFSTYKVALCKGYNKIDYLPSKTMKNKYWIFENSFVIYKDYAILPMISVGYSFNKELAVEMVVSGNAIITNIKMTF